METKNSLRKRFLNLLRNQKEEDRLNKSGIIREKLFALQEFKKAGAILFYASFDGEVETFAMMKQALDLGKDIALPIIQKDLKGLVPALISDLELDIQDGCYGIKEPKDRNRIKTIEEIDLVIVPGLAFDRHNFRLGRGAGYYDRFLASLPKTIPCFGLAYDFQMVERLPQLGTHDVPVSKVITN